MYKIPSTKPAIVVSCIILYFASLFLRRNLDIKNLGSAYITNPNRVGKRKAMLIITRKIMSLVLFLFCDCILKLFEMPVYINAK